MQTWTRTQILSINGRRKSFPAANLLKLLFWNLIKNAQISKVSRYFTTKNLVDNIFVPIAILVLCINFLSNFVVFTGQETVEQILELFPFQSVILHFFVLLVIFYVGVCTIDVFNINNYFFNGIKKNAVDIKEFYEEQERKLVKVYFSP